MKKLLSLLTLLFLSAALFAQSPLTLGPKFGLNVSKISQEAGSYTEKSIIGYQGGAFVRLSFGSLYVQPELLFAHKGGKLEADDNPHSLTDSAGIMNLIKINSIDIPLLVGYKIIDVTDDFNLRVMAGPVISINANKEVIIEVDGTEITVDENDPYITADDIKGGNWSLLIGGGIDFRRFTVDVRYNIGMANISDKVTLDNLSTFNISFGFKLL